MSRHYDVLTDATQTLDQIIEELEKMPEHNELSISTGAFVVLLKIIRKEVRGKS